MRRFEESRQKDFSRAEKRGHDNAACIKGMQKWCRHFEIERTAHGLYAEIMDLPIASHRISCPMVEDGSESMNLRWICSTFLIRNCDGCEHHTSNGDPAWGQEIIDQHKASVQKQEREVKDRETRTHELRSRFRSEAQVIGRDADPEFEKIVSFIEKLFSDDKGQRETAAERLQQSAQLASDLFPKSAIDLILFIAETKEYSSLIVPVCVVFSRTRYELSSRLEQVAKSNVLNRLQPESWAQVLDQLDACVKYPLDNDLIECLILAQNHRVPIGGWEEGKPTYHNSTAVLVRSFDANPDAVNVVFRRLLLDQNDSKRLAAAGGLELIQATRPSITEKLLSELVASLELIDEEWSTVGTASNKVVHVLQATFRQSPRDTDLFLAESMKRVRLAVQEEIVRVYRDQFFDHSIDWRERKARQCARTALSEAEGVAIKRLMEWVKNDAMDIETRAEAAEALTMACTYAPAGMIAEFDSLLGYYAIVGEQDEPPAPPPRIVLPGQPQHPQLEQLEVFGRKQQWWILKQGLEQCLQELADNQPAVVFDLISGFLEKHYSSLGNGLKGCCVSILGKVGRDYQLQPKVLPHLMRSLMDYESARIRSQAIEATLESFRYSSAAPPANIVETFLVHLRDPKVVVHKQSLNVVRLKSSWFNEQQSVEILIALQAHLKAYLNEPYQLDDICDAILAVGYHNRRLMASALNLVCGVFPTGEELVDSNIAEHMIYSVLADGPLAPIVATRLATVLAKYERDRLNDYTYSRRSKTFGWLHCLTVANYKVVEGHLFDSAKALALRDPWEALHFAGLFSQFHDFEKERDVLNTAFNGQPDEPRTAPLRAALGKMAALASANNSLQSNAPEAASDCLKEIGKPDERSGSGFCTCTRKRIDSLRRKRSSSGRTANVFSAPSEVSERLIFCCYFHWQDLR